MKICRFRHQPSHDIRIGIVKDDTAIQDLTSAGVTSLQSILEEDDPVSFLEGARKKLASPSSIPLSAITLCAPVEGQEVWAAGVTYLRSKKARMEESDFSASAYDRVYDAARPEIFFKSLAEKVVPTGDLVGIRRDARWNVPEPELALVINSRGRVVGYTAGNDMSSRDIEGENLLYLPQAKVYHRSCALGPWITLGANETQVRTWTIQIEIHRGGRKVFGGDTSVSQLKRSFDELAGYLFRSQEFPRGAVLLTGTGVVPDDSFTLQADDDVRIDISGIGRLQNCVAVV
jgi:2-dehydro-3-deoxy-D-arabinonate dehydratase